MAEKILLTRWRALMDRNLIMAFPSFLSAVSTAEKGPHFLFIRNRLIDINFGLLTEQPHPVRSKACTF